MIFTPEQNLPCLDGQDYNAYALYMQCLAEQLDQRLTEQQDELGAVSNRPSSRWFNPAAQLAMVSSTQLLVPNLDFQVDWIGAVPTTSALGNVRGWWMVGCHVTLVPSGAVTVDSFRRLNLAVSAPLGSPAGTPATVFSDVTWESNTGPTESLTVSGIVYSNGPSADLVNAGGVVAATIEHNNASTLNTVASPPTSIWVTFLGDTPNIEVV